jgi:D-glycero-alpha-D-manno-heptose-7-phosphate kinase
MRVSFAGGGSDLPPFIPGTPGRIVGTALDIRVRAVVEPFDRGWVRLELPVAEQSITRRWGDPPARDLAFRLLEAALTHTGITEGVRIRVDTDVVPGAGLGGSAAAAVASLCALRWSVGEVKAPEEVAREAAALEREGLHIVCGSQDQLFAACGGILDLRFGESGCIGLEPIHPDPALLAQLGKGFILVDTRVRRVSGDVLRRVDKAAALASVGELVASAGDVAAGLREGSLERVLAGMRRSAMAKLRRSPAANALAVELAEKLAGKGVEVIRVCGAGAGGHVLVWAHEEHHASIVQTLGATSIRRPALKAPGVRIEQG